MPTESVPQTTIRPLDDIRAAGAAWVTEVEIDWLAGEIERLRAALLWVDTAVAVGRHPAEIRSEIAKVLHG